MIDDCNINDPAKNQVSAVFPLGAIRKSASSKFIELCMESPCLCPSEEHKHGSRGTTKTSDLLLSFAIEMRIFTQEL